MAFFAPDIGIDLGSSRTRIYVHKKGVLIDEPTIAAVERGGRHAIWAIGEDAQSLVGRTTADAQIVRPLLEGAIQDYDTASQLIRYFVRKAIGNSYLVGPKALVTISCRHSPIERRSLRRAVLSAKARPKNLRLIEKPLAAAIGCDLPVWDPVGSMVVDVGGGTTEAAVIAMGGIVVSRCVKTGGMKMNDAVAEYAKKDFSLIISDRTAEDVKVTLGTALEPDETRECMVRGRDMVTNLPQTTALSSRKVYEALAPGCEVILGAIRFVLERTPPELAGDILKNGIYLTGGASQIYGLEQYIEDALDIPVHIPGDPARCAVNGLGSLVENPDDLDELIGPSVMDEEERENRREHERKRR